MTQILGWAGMVLIILAYYLLSTRKVSASSKAFNLINLFGGVFIIASALPTGLWPVVVLNAFWVIIALWALRRKA